MPLPSRLEQLAERIEQGEPVTAADLEQVAALQSLDLAIAAERFVAEHLETERAADDRIGTQ